LVVRLGGEARRRGGSRAAGAARDPPADEARALTADDLVDPFDELIEDALASLPAELGRRVSNVQIVVDEEPPGGRPLLGLYQGIPLTRRSSQYGGVLPDKITIYRGPLVRLYGSDPERLRREVRRVVLHELAHHFGISDQRLIEIDRY
jgi:predicted Zn-dependent protease with MMP-like domain